MVERLEAIWQENIEKSVSGLQAQFRSIDLDLKGDFRNKRQVHLEGTFRNSAVVIEGIGHVEWIIGKDDRPTYHEQRGIWEGKQAQAVDKGYSIKVFDDYIFTKSG